MLYIKLDQLQRVQLIRNLSIQHLEDTIE